MSTAGATAPKTPPHGVNSGSELGFREFAPGKFARQIYPANLPLHAAWPPKDSHSITTGTEPHIVATLITRSLITPNAWNMISPVTCELQEHLPDGATLLGVVLSSDKTKVSNLSGNHYTHPLLISLANINSEICSKGSLEAYIPLALLPIAKFIHGNRCMRGVLADRPLFHQCIGIVVEPLKQAARLGVMMSDPAGFSRYCFMPLVAYVANTPEELAITCITMNASPVTMATRVNFGDLTQHPLRKGSSTLANIRAVANFVMPSELTAFFEECKQHFLNGVLTLFWLDWLTADPSSFLTPELLHHLHKMFWDHDLRWCIKVVGAKEINFCFALLQIYLAQALWFTDEKLIELDGSLRLFHRHKQYIIDAGARQGKNGGIKPWAIPKLELLQGVVPSIRSHGAIMQWSADPTKHTHITIVKQPARAGNNHDHDTGVCHYLDCHDKVDRFDLVIKIRELEDHTNIGDDSDDEDIDSRMAPHPYHTFSTSITAYSLSYYPSLMKMTVNTTAKHFSLPDLRPAISDHLDHASKHNIFPIGGRYDSVIVNADETYKWPKSGLDGHFVAHLRLIFQPITPLSCADTYFAYVEHLDVVALDNPTGMYILRITQIKALGHLIPQFGTIANPQLTAQTSINHVTELFLNKFWNKELFYALHKA
ncbi:hypothetical protein BDR03DRAFT_1045519 [Suillus americanus]|nr:hypothetical protein BDR03DRAFT_1045519 [Suillus americanus]